MKVRHIGPVLALTILAALAAGCGSAPAPPQAFPDYNVLIIVLDSLRADHLGCYGYHRPTSPVMDAMAAEGVLFERAQSNSSYTNESIAALFSGRFPSAHAWGAGWQARPDPDSPTLAERFQAAGYATGMFSNTPQLNFPAFWRGFDEMECYAEWGHSGLGPRLVDRALRFYRDHRRAKSFVYLHFLDPHSPYDPPDDFYRKFADPPLPRDQWIRLWEDVRPHVPALVETGFGPGDPRFEDLVARYDAEIAFEDSNLGRLFEGMRRFGVLDKTLVVITADHGEEFLDHGYVEHAWRVYWESVHVPLIFHAPRALPPARMPDRVSLVDLAPTLLTFAGIRYDPEGFDGTALFRRDQNRWVFTPHGKPIIAENLMQSRNLVRMVQEGDYAYLAAQKWLSVAECSEAAAIEREIRKDLATGKRPLTDIWGPIVHEELYDMAADPGQQVNIIGDAPAEIPARMRRILEQYRRRCPAPLTDRERVLHEFDALLPAYQELFRSLGYLENMNSSPEESETPELESPIAPGIEEQMRTTDYLP